MIRRAAAAATQAVNVAISLPLGIALDTGIRFAEWLLDPEVIGPEECPLIHRWTIIGAAGARHGKDGTPVKLMVHRFLPNSADRDPHDHPRSFVTFVVKGRYEDHRYEDGRVEVMKPGTLRYRSATHTHMTVTGGQGCWTIVAMGPQVRPWGFWRDGEWVAFKDYLARFGHGMRCP